MMITDCCQISRSRVLINGDNTYYKNFKFYPWGTKHDEIAKVVRGLHPSRTQYEISDLIKDTISTSFSLSFAIFTLYVSFRLRLAVALHDTKTENEYGVIFCVRADESTNSIR